MCLVGATLECCFIMRSVPLRSLQSTSAYVHMDLHMGGEEGIWEQGGPGLCLLPSVHTALKLNSNKIRHRCALLAPTSIVRKQGGGPGLTRVDGPNFYSRLPKACRLSNTLCCLAALGDNHKQYISALRYLGPVQLKSCHAASTRAPAFNKKQAYAHQSRSRLTLIGRDNSSLVFEKRCPLTPFALILAVISVGPEFLPVSASCFKSLCVSFIAWN